MKNKLKISIALVIATLLLTTIGAYAADRPTQLKLGLRGAYVGTDSVSENDEVKSTLDVHGVVSPSLRIEFPVSEKWSLEAGARYEFYLAELDNSTSNGSSNLQAATIDFGPICAFAPFKNGTITPFLKFAVAVSFPEADLHAPTERFKTGVGTEVSLGFAADRWELRLGYEWMEYKPVDNGDPTSTQETFDAPQYFLEMAYKFNL